MRVSPSLFRGGAGLFGDKRNPVAFDVSENSSDVGAEVYSLSIGENFGAGSHAAASAGLAAAVVAGAAMVAGCALGGLTDCIAGSLVRIAEVRPGRDGLRSFDHGLLGWLLDRLRLRRWRQRSCLLWWRWPRDRRRRRCWSGSCRRWWSGLAHCLQLLQHLLIDDWP